MRRLMEIFCFAGILAAGCSGPVEIGNAGSSQEANTGLTSSGDGGPAPKTLYVTGVEYPADYNWRADLGSDAEGSTLFLMKDTVRIVELAVGYDNCISSDADMHRCIDGHLYTDFSTESETVIKEDGKELFRYAGREMIEDMLLRDGSVYTLGVPRSGAGWTCRCDGEILLSKSEGDLVGKLYEDEGSLVFSYAEPITDTDQENYYIVVDSVVYAVPNAPAYVDDIRRIDGTIYCVGGDTNSGRRSIYYDGQQEVVGAWSTGRMHDLRILYDGGDIIIYGRLGDGMAAWRWSNTEFDISSGSILGICVSGNECFSVANDATGGSAAWLFHDGNYTDFPEGYDFVYSGCIGADSDICSIGMTKPSDNYRPAIWTRSSEIPDPEPETGSSEGHMPMIPAIYGEITDFDFNGVFTGVYYQ